MDSDEWGRGEGWGLMEGEGVLLGHCRPCACSSSVCALIVLSVGIHYAWGARRRPWVGVVGCGLGRCSLFGCHVALGDVAPANRPVWSLVSESG